MECSSNFQWCFNRVLWVLQFTWIHRRYTLQILKWLHALHFHSLRLLWDNWMSECCLFVHALSLSPLCNQRESSHHFELFLTFSKKTLKLKHGVTGNGITGCCGLTLVSNWVPSSQSLALPLRPQWDVEENRKKKTLVVYQYLIIEKKDNHDDEDSSAAEERYTTTCTTNIILLLT